MNTFLVKIKKLKASKLMWSVFRALLLITIGFILIYPLIYMVSIAFRPYEQMTDPTVVWVPKSLTLQNVKDAWRVLDYGKSFLNSLKLNVVTSFLQVLSCALAGYGFSRFKFKGKNLLFAGVIFTIIVPPATTAIPMYMEYKYFDLFGIGTVINWITGTPFYINLRDSVWTFYIPAIFGSGIRSGLFIYIFRQFFSGLPKDLEDAAYVDGAGTFQTFIRIIVPTSASAFLTVFLFSVVWYWNDVLNVSMFFDDTKTVSSALNFMPSLMGQVFNEDFGNTYLTAARLEAGAFLTIAPLLIVFMFLQRYFVEGIANTGIKS